MVNCFLCNDDQADISSLWCEDMTRLVKCPNCGEYRITEQAVIEINNEIYPKSTFPIVAGRVFNSFYYNNEIKTVMTEDFRTTGTVITLEKLYWLAKFVYMESLKEGQTHLPFRPACCYASHDKYFELLDELKKLGILDFEKIISEGAKGASPIAMYLGEKMTLRAKMAFEKGIETVEEFERVFMGKNTEGGITVFGNGNQINKVSDHATQTAVQNNASNMAELQPLIERLLQAIPKDTSQEQIRQIQESVEAIQAEMQTLQPRKSLIRTILAGLNGVIRTTEFGAALAMLVKYFTS